MATSGNDRGCATTGCLILVCIFIPIVGHIILTLMIFDEDFSLTEKLLWTIVVWLIPFVGPFIYLLLGQRKNRLFGARPAAM